MEKEAKRKAPRANALANVIQSRKYFLVFFATGLNCFWHYKPMLMALDFMQTLQVSQQFMNWEIAIVGLYSTANLVGKHNSFSSTNTLSEVHEP
jgi:hypothetical protein